MAITAKQVNELRQKTGAGMMDCKKALVEAEGDMEAAVDLLRKQGQKVAAKRGDRDATEGLVIAKTNDSSTKGILLCLNCETDFVAKNEDFTKLANAFADIAVANDVSSASEFKKLPFQGITVEEKITEQTGVIGEKIDISGLEVIKADKVVAYNHPGNQIATIVGFNQGGDIDEVGRQVAMQVAAMAPIAVDSDSVPKDVIDRELEIGKELAIQEGKPAEMAEKIAQGRLNKFYKESTLLNQAFVRDNKINIKQFLQQTDSNLTVTDFKRISLSI